jgi:hypothetical protein
MKHLTNTLVVCALAALVVPAAALGQDVAASPAQQPAAQAPSDRPLPEQVRRPFRGLFGAPADPARSRQSLTMTLSAFGAYDDDLLAADSGAPVGASADQQHGWYSGATAGIVYARRGDRVWGGLQGDAAVNHYPSLHETTTMYRAGGTLSTQVARRTTLAIAADEVYAPQYRLGLFANPSALTGEADPFSTVITDLDLFRSSAYRTSAQASLSQGLGRRTSLDVFYAFNNVNYLDNEFDYSSQTAGLRFSRRVTQNLGFHAGYGYSTASYRQQDLAQRRIHNIDVGVDYGRALSVSRRTTLTFSTGSAAVAQGNKFTDSADGRFAYRFIGSANLRHEIGRTFSANVGYRRSVDFHEGFNEPFLSDAVTASYGGLLSRRLEFNSSADYAIGSVGLGHVDNGYSSASASAGLKYALSRKLAVYGRYVYYRYHFDSAVALDPRFVPALDRQGVRVGLTASFPILR